MWKPHLTVHWVLFFLCLKTFHTFYFCQWVFCKPKSVQLLVHFIGACFTANTIFLQDELNLSISMYKYLYYIVSYFLKHVVIQCFFFFFSGMQNQQVKSAGIDILNRLMTNNWFEPFQLNFVLLISIAFDKWSGYKWDYNGYHHGWFFTATFYIKIVLWINPIHTYNWY